jgi:hypothetical protein
MLGTSCRMSPEIAIMEAGWTPVDATIIAHKLRLLEQLKLQPEQSYQKHILTKRMEQVEQGNTQGLCYEAKTLWEQIGDIEQYTHMPEGKLSQEKRDKITAGAELIAEERQAEWLGENGGKENGYYSLLYQGGKARHLKNGNRKEIALMATVRAGAAILKGNKAANKKATAKEKHCTECDIGARETESHLISTCTYGPWTTLRAKCENKIKDGWTARQWNRYSKMKDRTKTLTLIGLPFEEPELTQTEAQWDNRDMAVKDMLLKMNSHRMTRLGRASMTGIALHQRTGQEWKTIIANKARELEEGKKELDAEEKERLATELREMRKTQAKQQREDYKEEQLLQIVQDQQEKEQQQLAKQSDPFGED